MDLISAIHACHRPGVIAVTGGGASAISELLSVPGASNTILEAVVPYDGEALVQYLKEVPEQFCSAETARKMAEASFQRAKRLSNRDGVWGLGCTASLASNRPKKGDHRFFIALRHGRSTYEYSLMLRKDARDRAGEEKIVSGAILNALAAMVGIDPKPLDLFPEEMPEIGIRPAGCDSPWHLQEIDGSIRTAGESPKLLFPGSYRPLHAGHRLLASVASAKLGLPVTFEISRTNVDKPPLTDAEIADRLKQFEWYAPVVVTEAPIFAEKAKLFPGCTFIAGADTAVRIVDPKYYANDDSKRDAALEELLEHGNSFLIAGRCDTDGRFLLLDGIGIPERYRKLFKGLSEKEFRADMSSTMLRGKV